MKVKIFVLLLCFFVMLIFIPSFFLRDKPVHISVDDFYLAFVDICQNKSYKTIFDQPLLKEFKRIHERTGAKFTLYTYAESLSSPNYSVDSLPDYFVEELNENFSWMKIGFHAATPDQKKGDSEMFSRGYEQFLRRFSRSQSRMVRLHYYYANQKQIEMLKNNGVKILLSADDDRVSYSLPPRINEILSHEQILSLDGVVYKRTDFRIEKTFFPIFNVWSHMTDDEIIFFTHEWALSPLEYFKFKITIFYLSLYGCKFVAD